jgi:hypothetical protein
LQRIDGESACCRRESGDPRYSRPGGRRYKFYLELTAAHVAGGKDAVDGAHVISGRDVAARVKREAKLVNHPILDGTEETHGE